MNDVGLLEFIRRHHVHYDVLPEAVVTPLGRTIVGFEVRLFAVHDKGARALPGCHKCTDLLQGLESLAQELIPPDERPTLIAMEPFDPVLYDSKDVPGADEIALNLRLCHRERYERPVDACEERCLKAIRARLKTLGVPER